jgi:hypothetical protein
MSTPNPLDAYTVPIESGTHPAPAGVGELSKERRAALDAALQELADARAEASVASRTYVVKGGDRG